MDIRSFLFENSDSSYRDFQSALMPTVDKERIIGVRTPLLRAFARTVYGKNECKDFLSTLPHTYYEEDNLHAFLIELTKDFDECIEKLNTFLPYVDNWATCDSMNPKVFKREHARLLPHIYGWLKSEDTYTVRFAIKMLMQHYLDSDFDKDFLSAVSSVKSDEYYVNMMVAWYFQTALVKRYGEAIKYIEEKRLPVWIHNKAIQKARESYLIDKDKKEYLNTLKIKK